MTQPYLMLWIPPKARNPSTLEGEKAPDSAGEVDLIAICPC